MDFCMDEKRIIDEIVKVLLSYLQPKRIILFGSRAKQRAEKYADFDIAVEGADMDTKVERFITYIPLVQNLSF